MRDVRIFLAASDLVRWEALSRALNDRGARTDKGPMAAVMSELASYDMVLLLPAPVTLLARWDMVTDELERCFILIQAFARAGLQKQRGGHVIALLPAAAAMGDPDAPEWSCFSGALLSLFRTLALEFRKLGMTANCLIYSEDNGGPSNVESLALLIDSIGRQPGTAINGQEIFAACAEDVGRLHP